MPNKENMKKWRFKTEEEFKSEDLWSSDFPCSWNNKGKMNKYLGQPVLNEDLDSGTLENKVFSIYDKSEDNWWSFRKQDIIEIKEVVTAFKVGDRVNLLDIDNYEDIKGIHHGNASDGLGTGTIKGIVEDLYLVSVDRTNVSAAYNYDNCDGNIWVGYKENQLSLINKKEENYEVFSENFENGKRKISGTAVVSGGGQRGSVASRPEGHKASVACGRTRIKRAEIRGSAVFRSDID